MPLFYYEGLQESGQRVRGTVEAISAQAARAALRQDNIETEELHEATLAERNELQGPIATLQPTEPERPPVAPATQKTAAPVPKVTKKYYPFIDTLRLYAGWLLAWYALVYALGSYQYTKNTYIRVPYVEALLPPFSSVVFTFTIVAFLFLLLTSIYKVSGATRMRAFSLWLLGIATFALYRLNV